MPGYLCEDQSSQLVPHFFSTPPAPKLMAQLCSSRTKTAYHKPITPKKAPNIEIYSMSLLAARENVLVGDRSIQRPRPNMNRSSKFLWRSNKNYIVTTWYCHCSLIMALAIFVIGNITTSMTIRQWSDVTYTDISINLGLVFSSKLKYILYCVLYRRYIYRYIN